MTATRPAWYDRAARIIALVALGFVASQLLTKSSPPPVSEAIEAVSPRQSNVPFVQPATLPAPQPVQVAPALLAAGTPIPDVAAAVLPSVVSIAIRREGRFGGSGGGSGVIIKSDGVILTNNHVLEGARDVRVELHDGRSFPAKVVGADPKSDLAVVKLVGTTPTELTPIRLGDADALRIGETVLAVGNPFGLSGTVTMGIVSALGRADVSITDYQDFIQTDAAINPGNSGGALVNARGELVGINTAIYAANAGGSVGVGFAIPTSLVVPVMESLLTTGTVERGWLGVYIADFTAAMAGEPGSVVPSETRGVLVNELFDGGPGAAAGLQVGDIIVSVDGKVTDTSSRLRNHVAHQHAGETVALVLLRDGQQQTLQVELGRLPDETLTPRKNYWNR